MAWNNICKSLRDILAELSPIEDDARRLIKDAHLPETEINFSGSASNFWTSIIDRAGARNNVMGKHPSPRCYAIRLIAMIRR